MIETLLAPRKPLRRRDLRPRNTSRRHAVCGRSVGDVPRCGGAKGPSLREPPTEIWPIRPQRALPRLVLVALVLVALVLVALVLVALVLVALVLAGLTSAGAGLALGAPASPPALATGPNLRERLAEPIGLTWNETPLRESLYRLGRTRGVGVLLDRRIDPEREVTLSVHATPLRLVFGEIASRADLQGTWVGPLAYFGTPRIVAQLETLAERAHQAIRGLPTASAQRLARRRGFAWPDFTTPRDLLNRLAEEAEVELVGIENIPHDLLAGANLPPMPWCDRLTVILLQFDLTYRLTDGGGKAVLMPIPNDLVPEGIAADSRPTGGGRTGQAGADGTSAVDPAMIRVDQITIDQVPVGAVLRQLARQLDLQLDIDQQRIDEAGLSLETRVSVQAQGVTLDELLRQIVDGTGLSLRREGRTLSVGPEAER